MNNRFIEAHQLIAQARESLRRGDKASARQLGERAAHLQPDLEDVWLVLAASDPNPRGALAYARKALQINPQSGRAQRAVEWASGRLNQAQVATDAVAHPAEVTAPQPRQAYQTAVAMPALQRQGRNWLWPALLVVAGCMVMALLGLLAFTTPNVAALVNQFVPARTQQVLWAQVEVAKPEITPVGGSAFNAPGDDTTTATQMPTRRSPEATATQAVDRDSTATATTAPTDAPTALPAATETPGSMVMEILEDTPTNVPPTPGISVGAGERWIDVDLTNQMLYAYEGETVVNSFVVSTGTWLTPTVTGKHKIYVKVPMQDMSGPGYHLRDVPYVMFFKGDYGLHGTYWHNNFGTPMSRGCVNLRIDDAAWLFDWASVGTIVNVHY